MWVIFAARLKIGDFTFLKIWSYVLSIVVIGGVLGLNTLHPGNFRLLISLILVLVISSLSLLFPQTGLLLLLVYVSFMGLLRRFLIPVSGWSLHDPLVLVAPTVVLFLGILWIYKRYMSGKLVIVDTRLFRLVRWLLLIDLLEIANPYQGNPLVGLGGAIFYIVPLFWMILGREYLYGKWVNLLINLAFLLGILGALYGLKQTFIGFSSFERDWINIAGYAALMVGHHVRAFSFFSSSAEYALFTAIATVISWVFILSGNFAQRMIAIPAIGLLAYALFLESSRGPIILVTFSILTVTILYTKSGWPRWFLIVITPIVLYVAYHAVAHVSTGNALVSHQVQGLSQPFNSKYSTLGLHWTMMIHGLIGGVTHPLGMGLGSTTLASSKFSTAGGSTEIDLSNMFVSDGILGGLVYLAIIIEILRKAFAVAKERTLVNLSVLGILLVSLSQWMIGGDYSTAAVIWMCVGYLDKKGSKDGGNISTLPDEVLTMPEEKLLKQP